MPVQFKPGSYEGYIPPANSLLVCAGTVHIQSVEGMGAGFNLFKRIFSVNKNWEAEVLCCFQNQNENGAMPPYLITNATAPNGLKGGVASVPRYDKEKKTYSIGSPAKPLTEEEAKTRYKNAVTGAIDDARSKGIPLCIQPLGTGEYGWTQKIAAKLYFEAIEADKLKNPTQDVTITIIFPADDFMKEYNRLCQTNEKSTPLPLPATSPPAALPPLSNANTETQYSSKVSENTKTLINHFQQKYPTEPLPKETPQGDVVFTFQSPKKASDFFVDEAKLRIPFFMKKVDDPAFMTSHCFYSCGNGTLYDGTPKDILSKLETENTAKPSPELSAGIQELTKQILSHGDEAEKKTVNMPNNPEPDDDNRVTLSS